MDGNNNSPEHFDQVLSKFEEVLRLRDEKCDELNVISKIRDRKERNGALEKFLGPKISEDVVKSFLDASKKCSEIAELEFQLESQLGIGDDDSEIYGDGEQSQLSGESSMVLRYKWSSGMDYNPLKNESLSEWCKHCYFGEKDKVKECIDSAKNRTHLLEKRESMLRFPALLHVICGARQNASRAANSDHLATFQLLLDSGCRMECKDVAGYTPLHYCLTCYGNEKSFEMAEILLKRGANPNVQNRFGCTPIHECIMNKKIDFIKLLLEHEADVGIEDNEGVAPQACATKIPSVWKLLSRFFIERARKEKSEASSGNCFTCKKPGASKKCPKCLVASYCDKTCQTEDWKLHKIKCKDYAGGKMKVALINRDSEMDVDLSVMYNFQSGEIGKIKEDSNPSKKFFKVKVQINLGGSQKDPKTAMPMYVYNRDRTVQGFLKNSEPAFKPLFELIRKKTMGGIKGYFFADVDDEQNLTIQTGNILPPEPW